jgi:hypothetical protein
MAIKLTFGRARGEPVTLGPFAGLLFEGGELRNKEDRRLIAVHEDHSWRVDGQRYSRFDIPGPVSAILLRGDQEQAYGPYTTMSCVDGVAYAEAHVFAFVDAELGDWYCIEDGRHWKCLEIREKRSP